MEIKNRINIILINVAYIINVILTYLTNSIILPQTNILNYNIISDTIVECFLFNNYNTQSFIKHKLTYE